MLHGWRFLSVGFLGAIQWKVASLLLGRLKFQSSQGQSPVSSQPAQSHRQKQLSPLEQNSQRYVYYRGDKRCYMSFGELGSEGRLLQNPPSPCCLSASSLLIIFVITQLLVLQLRRARIISSSSPPHFNADTNIKYVKVSLDQNICFNITKWGEELNSKLEYQ